MKLLLLALPACAIDYALVPPGQYAGDGDLVDTLGGGDLALAETDLLTVPEALGESGPQLGEPIEMRVDVALQRNQWGESTSRCQVQVAFEVPQYGGEAGDPPPSIEIPDEEGTCAYTALDWGEPGEWEVAGSLVGAESVWLLGEQTSLELERVETDDGGLRYEWADCSDEEFPFGEVFDLEIPESDGAVPAMYVEEAIGVSPDLRLLEPTWVDTDRGILVLPVGGDLLSAWTLSGDAPVVQGQPAEESLRVVVRNYRDDEEQEFEAIGCLPGGDSFDVPAADLALLEPNPDAQADEQAPYQAAFQVDAIYDSPGFETPWGQVVDVRSTVTEGGVVHLYE